MDQRRDATVGGTSDTSNMRSSEALMASQIVLATAHRFQPHPYWLSRCDLCGIEEWEHEDGPTEKVFAWSVSDFLEGTTFWMQYADFASFGDSPRWLLWVRTARRIMCVSDPHLGLTLPLAEFVPSSSLGRNELRGIREAASCPA